MSAMINGKEYRLQPELVSGKGWQVVITTGNKKKGTRVSRAVSEPCYTLAQALSFCENNRTADFAEIAQ